jgi:hypothetical protein
MTHERQRVSERPTQTGASRLGREPRGEEIAAPAQERSGLAGLLSLQRSIGNRAVLRLVQRAEESRSVASPPQPVASPLPVDLRPVALGLIEQGQSARSTEIEQVGRTFLATGQLAVRALQAGVMAKPQFLCRRVDLLRRGAKVTVLDRAGSWYRVRTESGATGWMHGNRLIPRVVRLRSGETGSGNTRGEWETAGRG